MSRAVYTQQMFALNADSPRDSFQRLLIADNWSQAMHKTPWTKQSSSLPSDRIKPTTKGLSITSKTQGKGKQSQPPEYPKSRAVRRLEILIEDVRVGLGRECDPKGGCFCLGTTSILHFLVLDLCSFYLFSKVTRAIVVHTAMSILWAHSMLR